MQKTLEVKHAAPETEAGGLFKKKSKEYSQWIQVNGIKQVLTDAQVVVLQGLLGAEKYQLDKKKTAVFYLMPTEAQAKQITKPKSINLYLLQD